MGKLVTSLEGAFKENDLQKLSATLDKWEEVTTNVDVQSEFMQGAIASSSAAMTPASEVDNLIKMVADEHGLEVGAELNASGAPSTSTASGAKETDDLAARLEALKSI